MKQSWARHFSLPHPLFRKEKTPTGIWWEKSVYHYWWLFLREHEGYRSACAKSDKGKYAKLFDDFGDVHITDFKSWFTKDGRGVRLFAEPAVPIKIVPLSPEDLKELPENFNEHLVLLAIDKSLALRVIMKRVRSAMKMAGAIRKRGQKTQYQSRARYPIATKVPNSALKKIYEIHKYYEQNPKMKLWEIGNRYGLSGPSMKPDELDAARSRKWSENKRELTEKKNRLTVAARRYLKNAESIIEWVGKGKFPVFTTTEP